jgi:hypothetical protein
MLKGAMWSGLGAAMLLSIAGATAGQVPSAVAREGDLVPFGGSVTSLPGTAISDAGGWAVMMITSDGQVSLHRVFGSPLPTGVAAPAEMLVEGTYSAISQSAYEGNFGIDDAGVPVVSATVTAGDSVWQFQTPIAIEGNAVSSLPGQFWTFGSRPRVTSQTGVIYWAGGVAATSGGLTSNRGLFVGPGATPVILGGQSYPNLPTPLVQSGFSFEYRISGNGTQVICPVTLSGATTATDGAVLLNGQGLLVDGVLMREGNVIPASAGGLAGETYAAILNVGVNNSGRWMVAVDTSAATTTDDLIMIDGQVRLREGTVIDGLTLSGDPEHVELGASGDVLAAWDVTNNTLEALVLNRRVLVKEGDAVDLDGDGMIETTSILTNLTGTASAGVSGRFGPGNSRLRVIFLADVDTLGTTSTLDDTNAAFTMIICLADYNRQNGVTVQDIFDFLAAWNDNNLEADFNVDGMVSVQDIFDFLSAWNGGPCP